MKRGVPFLLLFHRMVKQANSVKQFSEKDLLAKTTKVFAALMPEIPFIEMKEAKQWQMDGYFLNTFPGIAPVCAPSFTTNVPFTIT
ncbi:MAG: hypothetical protein HW415_2055 [Deltaproteobacteria bacterium]|nr:hypothetical protein [Deltaproteobacteria bacterium]